MAGGEPTASLSGGTNNAALYLTADGTVGTTARQSLLLGSSTTGRVSFFNDNNFITSAGNLTITGSTTLNSQTYTWPTPGQQSSGYVLTTDGTGNLSWVDAGAASSNFWQSTNGAVYTKNPTLDLFLGGKKTD